MCDRTAQERHHRLPLPMLAGCGEVVIVGDLPAQLGQACCRGHRDTQEACPGELPDIQVTATTGSQRVGGRGQGIPAGARVRPSGALAVDNIQPRAIRAEAHGMWVPARGEEAEHAALRLLNLCHPWALGLTRAWPCLL